MTNHRQARRRPARGGRPARADRHVSAETRRGAVAVEFAFVAPVLLTLMLGVIEVNRLYDAQNLMESAAREGARFASMDREGLVPDGMTANQKMMDDVKLFLESNGIPRDSVAVSVTHHNDPSTEFDIEDPANDLQLFEVRVAVDYSAVSYTAIDAGSDYQLSSSVVFRNGRATIAD
ncbi:MAG: TadE family protein [Planctomycetota bacterium]